MMKVLFRTLLILILIAVVFVLGYFVRGKVQMPRPSASERESAEGRGQLWTCSMHPQIKLPKPGKCPTCFMDLIALETDVEEEGQRVLVLSETAKALAEIQTSPVERKFVTAEIRMVGKVDYDETRLAYITAWVPGRIDRLYVDYTGVPVKKGDHMVYLYSPELYASQEELLQALKAVEELARSDLASMKETAAATVDAAREKLRLLGLTPQQIANVERTRKASDHMTIYAPIGGIVVHKNAFEGMYVQTGTRIYTIADLKHVWVKLDAYESDLAWIQYGQEVEFESEAYPGRRFTGKVAFIDPVLNARTRTAKVRLNVENEDGALKPEMFVHAVLRAQVSEDGLVMDNRIVGKWLCYMHPEVVKDGPGRCDRCEMPLVTAESLGFVTSVEEARPPLVIPATAPLITGDRAVVYVQLPDREKPAFQGREVILGPRAGDYYLVREGLKEGELVVTNGNFKIDSALQIRAEPSMMSMPAGPVPEIVPASPPKRVVVPKAFAQQITKVLEGYLGIWRALASDDAQTAAAEGRKLANALAAVDPKLLTDDAHVEWMKRRSDLQKSVEQFADAKELMGQRKAFDLLSQLLPDVLKRFGMESGTTIIRFHCPMAFDGRGAHWLQDSEAILNPYFGAAMLKCGEQTEVIAGGQSQGDRGTR